MSRIIHLHNIRVRALDNSHADLPTGMQLFAQIIVDGRVVKQTVPVDSEDNQTSWKVRFDCDIPHQAPTFWIAILRKARDIRFLGSIEIGRAEALSSGEQRKALYAPFVKVNTDGPSLQLTAAFSMKSRESPTVLEGNDIMGAQTGPVNTPAILSQLIQMLNNTKSGIQLPSQEFWIMHERILLFSSADHVERGRALDLLGHIYLLRWMKFHIIEELHQAVGVYEDAHRDLPNAHSLHCVGIALLHRVDELRDVLDITKCVSVMEEVVQQTANGDLDKPSRLHDLGRSFFRRFQHSGDSDDLNRAVLMAENVVELMLDSHPDKPSKVHTLGNLLHTRFEKYHDVDDLTKAVLMHEDAVHSTPDSHSSKPSMLNILGKDLHLRFERLGDLDDLNKSVVHGENAIHLTLDGHPEKSAFLHDHGAALVTRFEYLGGLDDLNKAVHMGEYSVRLTPDDHSDKPRRLNILCRAFFRRFERLGNMDDLNKSVLMGEHAVHLTPEGHAKKASHLSQLAISFFCRFQRRDNLDDLHKALLLQEDAIQLFPDSDTDKPMQLCNHGASLLIRFERLGDRDDLDRSVMMLKDGLRLLPDGHPEKPSFLYNLGNAFISRLNLASDLLAELDQTLFHFISAARSTTGSAQHRFRAASVWADLARIARHPSTLDAYHVAFELLPKVTWLGLSITDRHHHLLKAGKVVRNGASAAIASGQPEKAVEWLEQGRSVIWGQLLNLRTPVDALKNRHPELAQKLLSLSTLLDGSGIRTLAADSNASGIQKSLRSIADQAHESAYDWDEVLKQIRKQEGFEQFLLPRPFSELTRAAQKGPVVILNISDQCDALILIPGNDDEVMHIPLPDFQPANAESLLQSLRHIVGRSGRLTMEREGTRKVNSEDEFGTHLAKLWLTVVRPILDGLAITTPRKNNLPRIWWCLTGPLAFLPIHAAGLYGPNDGFGSKLSDFVISSYTPSLTALIEGFRPPSESHEQLQLLAVAQPSASGQSYIPGTQEEITHIERLAKGKLPVLRLEGRMATLDSVQQGMRDSKWVHFACHGVQDIYNPTESALLLAGDSRLSLSTIIQLALPHADLAFLSACQTATGDRVLQEESVHLAAGMLLAGYRGVIATMWTIMDNDAPQIASDVYEHMFKTSPPDSTQAAEALHLAVQKLREASDGIDGKKPFSHWVPFIHVGV